MNFGASQMRRMKGNILGWQRWWCILLLFGNGLTKNNGSITSSAFIISPTQSRNGFNILSIVQQHPKTSNTHLYYKDPKLELLPSLPILDKQNRSAPTPALVRSKNKDNKYKDNQDDSSWFVWLARLRIHKKKLKARRRNHEKNARSNNSLYPYTYNAQEEMESRQLSVWVNAQVHKYNLSHLDDEYTKGPHNQLDTNTLRHINLLLKELPELHEILPTTVSTMQFKTNNNDEKVRIRNKGPGTRSIVWNHYYEELIQYKHQHGHTRVPQQYAPNKKLGDWVSRQRLLYGSIVLSKDLDAFLQDTTDSNDFDGMKLKSNNSYRFKNKQLAQLRIQKLLDIEFDFQKQSTSPTSKVTWDIRYNELLNFVKENGHCNVPFQYQENPKLGYWANLQRKNYKGLKLNKLDPNLSYRRFKALEQIGFQWGDESKDDLWQGRYEELCDYYKAHGNCNGMYCSCISPPANNMIYYYD